jgi:hypothetical protein
VHIRDVTAYWMPRLKRGMTTEEHDSALPQRNAPEVMRESLAPKTKGVGNAGCSMHPQPRV